MKNIFKDLILLAILMLKSLDLRPTKPQVRVLLYHDIAEHNEMNFSKQMQYYLNNWNILSPKEFEDYLDGNLRLTGNSLLFTFDDGFKSNRIIAEKYLNENNIKAIFFIISDFVKIRSANDSKLFILKNIYPLLSTRTLPSSWQNMDEDDIIFLQNTGHTIGFHTKSHQRLSNLTSKDFFSEIALGKQDLEKKIKREISHFAYTFGDINSISRDSLIFSTTHFKYIHTGLRGNNDGKTPHPLVFRDSVDPGDSLFRLNAMLNGTADLFYKKSIKKMKGWFWPRT